MWGGYTSSLKDFAKQNRALDLWRFRGLGFNMMCAQVESSSKKISRFNDSWRFGFGVPMLELVNCNKLQSLIFLFCSCNSQCSLGWTNCLLFAPLILNSCSLQGCRSIPSSILNPYLHFFYIYFFNSCKLWVVAWEFINILIIIILLAPCGHAHV
jgi:hypothetical protein